jgi:hypothetical protein
MDFLTVSLSLMADSSGAITAMREYVVPIMQALVGIASLASVAFLVYGGFLYMTSRGAPDKLDGAKRVLKNALLGLVIVLGAATLTAILAGSVSPDTQPSHANLPNLQSIEPKETSNGLVEVLINAIMGLLSLIIQTIATPFLSALEFFTKATPLMTDNPTVFNLWLAMVGIVDVLFVVVVALLGFHVMSASTFGFDEIDFKHLLPRIILIFLLINTSIFAIDAIIGLSNALITAISKVGGASSVWDTLIAVVGDSGGQGVAALLIMLAFLIFAVILIVYYVVRLVVLLIGAVLAPLVLMIWLIPGFRDFSETAIKTYITTIFVLFVHVVILLLASSLFAGMSAASGNDVPNTLIAMVTGLATVVALLKTQGVMNQFSYVSLGPRSMRQLGGKFISGVSHMTQKQVKAGTKAVSKKITAARTASAAKKSGSASASTASYRQPHGTSSPGVKVTRTPASEVGKTQKAPEVKSDNKPLVSNRQLSLGDNGIAKTLPTGKEKK